MGSRPPGKHSVLSHAQPLVLRGLRSLAENGAMSLLDKPLRSAALGGGAGGAGGSALEESAAPLVRDFRAWLYATFEETGRAPFVEEALVRWRGVLDSREDVRAVLWALNDGHHIMMAPLSSCEHVLMAWPFSNLPTAHRVRSPKGSYYAN